MDNQYYTPTIEEFHVGFEYQHNALMTNMLFWWLDKTVKNDTKIKDIESDISVRKIRVKHLDKEDIKDLGWRIINEDKISKNITFNICGDDTGMFELFFEYKGRINIKSSLFQYSFNGTLKNKSELRKIMIQLGIIKN